MRALVACVLASFSSSALAEQPMQFDLHCNGTAKMEAGKAEGPFQRVIHVDLATSQYCNDECASVRRIVFVDPLKISIRTPAARPPERQARRSRFAIKAWTKRCAWRDADGSSQR